VIPRLTAAGALLLALAAASCGSPEPTAGHIPDAPASAASTPKVVLDIDALSGGAAPKVGWRHGREIHDGERVVTVDSDIDAFVLTRKRLITETFSDSGTSVDVRDDDGNSTASYPIGSGHPVENAERTIVSWVDDKVTPWVLQDDQVKPLAMPKPDGASSGPESNGEAVAVLGHDCAHGAETVEGAGCSVFFNWFHDPKSDALVSSNHGFTDRAGGKGINQLFDVSPDQAMIGDSGAGVENPTNRYERDGKGYVATDFLPRSFSPDGSKILALPGILKEGPASDEVSIRRASTGMPLLTAQSPKDHVTIWETVWEDDSHLLSVVQQGEGRWAIVRFGLDGKAELAVKPINDNEGAPALSLAVQP
jgi:hypothetical protein